MRRALACLGLLAGCSATPDIVYGPAGADDAGGDGATASDGGSDSALSSEAGGNDARADDAATTDAGGDSGLDDSGAPTGLFCPPVPWWATACEGAVPCVARSANDCNDKSSDCQKCTQPGQRVCCVRDGEASCVRGPLSCRR
jgi:hypothetical protein